MTYDDTNIFARILRGEIPNKTVYEDEHVLAFEDINPARPVHVLVIPKGPFVSFEDFAAKASDAQIAAWVRAIGKVAEKTGVAVSAGGGGFRVISNAGDDGHQEVPHLHPHVVGGAPAGPMLRRA